MKHTLLGYSTIVMLAIATLQAGAQTKCIWIEKWDHGSQTQRIGLSIQLVKLLARPNADFTIDDTHLSFDSLLLVYNKGSMLRVKDSTGVGETRIHRGTLDMSMKESSARHNHLFIVTSDSGESPKVTKVRVESAEAVAVVLAMIGSKNLGEDIDRIEGALQRGGIIYISDLRKRSVFWIYVN